MLSARPLAQTTRPGIVSQRQSLSAEPQTRRSSQQNSPRPSRPHNRSPIPQQQSQHQRTPLHARQVVERPMSTRPPGQSLPSSQAGQRRPVSVQASTQVTSTSNRPNPDGRRARRRLQAPDNDGREQQPKKPGMIRRAMAHPGMKMAVVATSALALGGAAGTRFSGLVDQWSSGNYAGGGVAGGGAGLLGDGGCGDDEDEADDGGYGGGDETYSGEQYDAEYTEGVYADEFGNEYGAQDDMAYEDNLMDSAYVDDSTGYGYADGQDAGGGLNQGSGPSDPYQTGPCFEDNTLLSSMRP